MKTLPFFFFFFKQLTQTRILTGKGKTIKQIKRNTLIKKGVLQQRCANSKIPKEEHSLINTTNKKNHSQIITALMAK